MVPVADIFRFFSSLLPLRHWKVRVFGGVSSSFLPPPPPPQSHCQVGWGVVGREMLLPEPVMWPRDGGACVPGGKQGMRVCVRMDEAWRLRKERWASATGGSFHPNLMSLL